MKRLKTKEQRLKDYHENTKVRKKKKILIKRLKTKAKEQKLKIYHESTKRIELKRLKTKEQRLKIYHENTKRRKHERKIIIKALCDSTRIKSRR
ncbi:MAG: hypothetical protein JRC90_03980 [Deltaproteobacteria bacterium]|nr:hypothetical protein [Deltaproteobacteria bacterium]